MKAKMLINIFLILIILSLSPNAYGASDREEGIKDGSYYGNLRGELEGFKDYLDDNKRYYSYSMPKDSEIRDEFNLDDGSYKYRYYFLSEYKKAFREGYENIFDELESLGYTFSKEIGIEHGTLFGNITGETYGRDDYYKGSKNNWTQSIPSITDIVKEYSLYRDYPDYKTGFIVGYTKAFEESYTTSFRDTNIEGNKITKENGISHGEVIGSKMGKIHAEFDYSQDLGYRWAVLLPDESAIVNDYKLYNEEEDYKLGFINGYRDGFKVSYVTTYQDLNINDGKEKFESFSVDMEGGNFTTSDGNLNITIDKGSIYEKSFILLEKKEFPIEDSTLNFNPASNIYTLSVKNSNNSANLKDPLIISFKYYGDSNGGIYKFEKNKWIYQPSYIKDNKIYTVIEKKNYKGGTYSLFIDDSIKHLSDLGTHWGRDEINTYIRRRYITGYSDGTFKPEKSVTRGEFVTILGRILNWKTPTSDLSINNFKDHMVFGPYKNSIISAVARGYITGYPDKTFRPNLSITYEEIEWIIKRLPGNKNFKWDSIRDLIFEKKGIRSNSFNNKKSNITRSEVVFLLYTLEEKGLL